MKKRSLIFLPFLLLNILSCARSQEILGIPREEAFERLKKGDAAFIQEADLPAEIPAALKRLEALSRLHPASHFYAGLLTEDISSAGDDDPGRENKIPVSSLLFALALKSPSSPARREAAAKLILPCLETGEISFAEGILKRLKNLEEGSALSLKNACLYRLGRFDELVKNNSDEAGGDGVSSWDRILPLLAAIRISNDETGRNIKDFFFEHPVDDTWKWALAELQLIDADFFTSAETALLSGRAAVARYSYGEGLLFFREVIADISPNAPHAAENYFFRYPELLSDLGRAFQFTPGAQDEGASLFAEWKTALRGRNGSAFAGARYRLAYFSGRIERQRGEYNASSLFFREALEAAPDSAQADACVWYILMNALTDSPENAVELVKEFLPRMASPPYFSDIMDRLARYLTNTGQWEAIPEIFELLKKYRHAAVSQYGWIAGRAAEEGLLKTETPPGDFFRTAFEEGRDSYYRAMSASKLKIPFLPQNEEKDVDESSGKKSAKDAVKTSSDTPANAAAEAEFILDFFELGCGDYVVPYLKNAEAILPAADLRKAVKALAEHGNIAESLNLAARSMAREDYGLDREALLLYYPRHFQELIESRAGEAGIEAALLFGLVRTESAFMNRAVSHAGAVGLGQLLPSTALDMAGRIARRGGPDYRINEEVDLRDPEINIHISAYYLRYLIDLLGTPMTAVLAYNGGLGRVRRWRAAGAALPEDLFLETVEFPETREYGRRVLAAAAMYGWLYYGMSMEAVIADIYR